MAAVRRRMSLPCLPASSWQSGSNDCVRFHLKHMVPLVVGKGDNGRPARCALMARERNAAASHIGKRDMCIRMCCPEKNIIIIECVTSNHHRTRPHRSYFPATSITSAFAMFFQLNIEGLSEQPTSPSHVLCGCYVRVERAANHAFEERHLIS